MNRTQFEAVVSEIEKSLPNFWAEVSSLYGDEVRELPVLVATHLEAAATLAELAPEAVSGWLRRLGKACRALR